MIVMSGRFVKYLAEAAAGDMDAGILFALIGYRLPGFLELIIPLACFLGVLLAYGRLYVQSEMTVMIACGMSQTKLILYTLAPALIVAILASYLSLFATPDGARKVEALISDQNERGDLDGMAASHFYPIQKGKGVTYTEEINKEGLMLDVFLAEHHPDAENGDQLILTVSKTGEQKIQMKV
jgi:lipopolysaccharide export system permease protein